MKNLLPVAVLTLALGALLMGCSQTDSVSNGSARESATAPTETGYDIVSQRLTENELSTGGGGGGHHGGCHAGECICDEHTNCGMGGECDPDCEAMCSNMGGGHGGCEHGTCICEEPTNCGMGGECDPDCEAMCSHMGGGPHGGGHH